MYCYYFVKSDCSFESVEKFDDTNGTVLPCGASDYDKRLETSTKFEKYF